MFTMPKLLLSTTLVLFIALAIAVLLKEKQRDQHGTDAHDALYQAPHQAPIEIPLAVAPAVAVTPIATPVIHAIETIPISPQQPTTAARPVPEADRIAALFSLGTDALPIVETITYKSRVPWLKGRPAWLSDYATHYTTSRHFIARSLNGKPDYLKQDVSEGNRFTVLRLDKQIAFHLVVDLSRCKMWLYYHDLDNNERVLLKSYIVGIGRLANNTASGLLTPCGCYRMGDKVAVYKPKTFDFHGGVRTEMIRIFGTRWIPFGEELRGCSTPAKGLGIHGVPWIEHPHRGWEEDTSSLGKHESDGCIRLNTADMEELFAIIITKPTTVELVHDFFAAQLPGVEAHPQ